MSIIREREMLSKARREHAFLLRCEGLTYQQIGERLGMHTRNSSRIMVYKFGRELARALRKTKFK